MVTMVTNQKIFDELYLFETFEDEPIPHKNFTLLGQGSHEILGGLALVSDVGSNTLGNRRVKISIFIKLISIFLTISNVGKNLCCCFQ